MLPETVLHIADTEKWLLQPELKAIKEGLEYVIQEGTYEGIKYSYRGYLYDKRLPHGVGITTFEDG